MDRCLDASVCEARVAVSPSGHVDLVKLFRLLILGEVTLLAASVVAAWLAPEYPEAVQNYFDSLSIPHLDLAGEGNQSHAVLMGAAAVLLMTTWIVALIGLWNFKRWARPTYIAYSTLSLLMIPFFGPTLASGAEGAIDSLSMMVSGALMAAMLFSPVRARFAAQA
jgi:hypothetical protein